MCLFPNYRSNDIEPSSKNIGVEKDAVKVTAQSRASEGFFQGGHEHISPKVFLVGRQSGEIWCFPLEPKKTTFSCYNLQNPGGKAPPSDTHERSFISAVMTDFSRVGTTAQYGPRILHFSFTAVNANGVPIRR